MSTTTVNYFHSVPLRQRYLDELDAALQSNRLRAQERAWLQQVTQPMIAGRSDPVRVDRLVLTNASFEPFELSAALLLSHGRTDVPRVYLYTLADGIEAFSDRRVLLAALRERFADGDPHTLFEYEKIDGDPFRAQMLAIVDHQVEQITQLTAQLKLTPSLQQAASASISRQLRASLAHLSIDPDTHPLQIIPTSPVKDEFIPVARTLTQSTFDDFCNVQLAKGYERRFLDAQGRLANTTHTALFTEALADAAAGVAERYAALLKAFWGETWDAQRTRRDLAIESLHGSWCSAVYRHRHDETLSAGVFDLLRPVLQSITGTLPTNAALRCSRLIISVGETKYPLAGTFVLHSAASDDRSLLWFSPDHSLVRFTDRAALATHFASVEGRAQLRPTLALQDQAVLLADAVPQVTLEAIQGPFFADRVDSILALQARNLAYVMTLSTSPDEMTAMIDDALDIRQLLDPRQLQLGTGRWRRDAPFNFADVWPGSRSEPPDTSQALAVTTNSEMGADETPIPAPAGESLSPDQSGSKEDASRAPKASWMELTQAFDMRAERLRQTGVVLREFAEQAVQSYLCVLVEGAVQAGTIRVQWLESEPVDPSDVETVAVAVSESQRSVSMGLVSLLLECVSGHRSLPLPAAVQVVPDSMSGGEHLQGVLINHMLDKLVRGFTDRYVAHFEQSRIEFQRQGDRPLRPDREALSLREDAMHLDLSLNWRLERIDDSANDMVRQILGWPVRSLRMAFDTAMTEAFSVSLTYGGNVVAVLCDTLVLRQPLTQGSPVMFWTGTRGWGQFSSVEDMQAMLQRKLHGAQREGWLALLCERDQTLLRDYLLKASDNQVQVRLDRIDGNAIQSLQQQILDRKRQDLRQLCLRAVLCRFESGLFTRLAAVAELDEQLVNTLDGLSLRIDNSIFAAMLPSWLSSASLADLKRYQESLRRFYLVSCEDKDFLFDIPPLRAYAYQRLVAQLTKDFPNQSIDPNQVNVTLRHYVNAFPIAGQLPSAVPAATVVRSEPLTEYAINRFVETQDAAVSVSSVQPDVTRALTPDYLRQLVRGLDVGAGYTTLLRKALATNDPHYAARKRLFIHQLPPLLLALALSEKLKGALSTKAYQFISRVVEMPDGIARPYLGRDRVIISPLQLIADAGMSPDTVAGAYVICPAARDKGPVVLYVIYHPQFSFREYETRAALIEDIRTNEALQELLLDRLDPEIRRRYAHGGFIEPHLPFAVGLYDVPFRAPGPVTLGMTEVKGNALQFLFRDRIKLLLDVGQSNVVTNDQVDWVGKKFLATLGLEQTLALLPGKLAALVTLWQSHTLFRASAMSASGHRWGKALSEFSAALGVMVAAREQAIEEQTVKDEENEVRPSAAPSTFSWYDTTLNAEQRMRLQSLEANSVALDEMRHDELLNVYFDKRDDTPYAVVDGKVYQVKRLPDEGRLVIVGADGAPGPRLILDTHQQWQLDLSLKLRGGGGIVTKLNSSGAARSAEDVLIVEAKGMSEIRLLYRDRARRIGQAHHQARCYLQTSLDNLNVKRRGAELDPRVKRIIGDFFGTEEPGPELLAEIESAIKGLFDALMEDSLSPFTSPRFVVGSNRSGRDTVVAFVIKTDPKRRVFLTERFFHVPHFDLHPQAAAEGFNATIHYQAANLMHELSHQALDTSDIAYLEAMAPYPDLLREDTPWNSGLRAYVDGLHNHRLSVTALRDNLFTLQDAGTWRDIEPDDDRGYDTILRLTNTTNLNDARDAFLSDVQLRSRVMLSNADSLTLLVLRLGRRSYWVPKP